MHAIKTKILMILTIYSSAQIKYMFYIIAVHETRITDQASLTTSIILKNYAIELNPTESSAGSTLLYPVSHLTYKPLPDLNIFKANQLESTSVETINRKKSNDIIGCFYKHPNTDLL